MSERRSFVAAIGQEGVSRWLSETLRDDGEIVAVDKSSLEQVLQLLDMTGARLAFVDLCPATLHQDAMFLEGLVAAKPLLPVVAVAKEADQTLLLSAMRAGARDFVTQELRGGDVAQVVHRLIEKAPHSLKTAPGESCWTAAVLAARPGNDAPMFALHMALAVQAQSPQNRTLLLDLGAPPADTLLFLGIKSSYTFVDAVRSLRRLDATLIETAFGKHKSGLSLLAMPDDPHLVTKDITSADVYVLLGALRRFFTHIVINLGGVLASDFLYLILGRADRVVFVVEQSLPSCKQSTLLLQRLRENKIDLTNAGVVVDHYLEKMPPSAKDIASGMGLPLLASLPSSGMARLAAMNSGESMFDTKPRDPYAVSLQRLTHTLVAAPRQAAVQQEEGAGLFAGLRGWLSGDSSR